MKVLKTNFCHCSEDELLARYDSALLMMKVSKDFAVFENTTVVFESNDIDEAAKFAIQPSDTPRYLYCSFSDTISTQEYIKANKEDYFDGYYIDECDEDYDGEPSEDDDSDEAEYHAMRDREIRSYTS